MITPAKDGFSWESDNHRWEASWKYHGEGFTGEYQPHNPYDRQLFRVFLRERGRSVCDHLTLASFGAVSDHDLIDLSSSLFDILDRCSDFDKQGFDRWLLTTAARRE